MGWNPFKKSSWVNVGRGIKSGFESAGRGIGKFAKGAVPKIGDFFRNQALPFIGKAGGIASGIGDFIGKLNPALSVVSGLGIPYLSAGAGGLMTLGQGLKAGGELAQVGSSELGKII